MLLTALALAWRRCTSRASVAIDLERHGRDALSAGPDVSRTVGWFTALVPVCLVCDDLDVRSALIGVKEQLRRVPRHGASYGVLRHLASGETGDRMRRQPRAEISFNYLGQVDDTLAERGLFTLAGESDRPDAGRAPAAIARARHQRCGAGRMPAPALDVQLASASP